MNILIEDKNYYEGFVIETKKVYFKYLFSKTKLFIIFLNFIKYYFLNFKENKALKSELLYLYKTILNKDDKKRVSQLIENYSDFDQNNQ